MFAFDQILDPRGMNHYFHIEHAKVLKSATHLQFTTSSMDYLEEKIARSRKDINPVVELPHSEQNDDDGEDDEDMGDRVLRLDLAQVARNVTQHRLLHVLMPALAVRASKLHPRSNHAVDQDEKAVYGHEHPRLPIKREKNEHSR